MASKKNIQLLCQLFPDLAFEWDYESNEKSIDNIAPFSHYKANWICGKCGYKWKAEVKSRTKLSRGCPACNGQIVIKGKNDLESRFPHIALEWDYVKNQPVLPSEVSFGSTKKYFWKCPTCKYTYDASVNQRTNSNSGCPYCSNHKVMSGFNDFQTMYPALALEWDFDNNGGLLPNQVLCNRHQAVNWVCRHCNRSYQAYIYNRIRGDGCPYCSGHKVLQGHNDLATLRPDLLKEWDYESNLGFRPEDFTIGSNSKVWWSCIICGHKWKTSIVKRTSGAQCPKCNRRNHTSFPEQAIFYYVSKVFSDAINGFNEIFDDTMELDIYIPSIGVGIEYDGLQWHSQETELREKKKYEICKSHHIMLLRIREGNESPYCDAQIACPYQRKSYTTLDNAINQLFLQLQIDHIEINTERDATKINEQYLTTLRKGSFGALFPELSEEWDNDKNGTLTPFMFFPYSNEMAWWKCKQCGVNYQMTISAKANGHKCRKCAYITLSSTLGKKVKNIDTGLVFESMRAAAKFYGGKNASSISECCRGLQKTAFGYRWTFVD